MRRSLLVLITFIGVQVAHAQNEIPPRLQQAFRSHRAEVHVANAGLVRVPMPDEVLAQARPDLEDVLLFDGESGAEVPVFLANDTSMDRRTLVHEVELTMHDYHLRPELSERVARYREEFAVTLPAPPCSETEPCAWPAQTMARLRFAATQQSVHSEVRILDSASGAELAHGTLFLLPDGRSNWVLPVPTGARTQLRIEIVSLDRALEAHVYAQMEALDSAPMFQTQTLIPVRTLDNGGTRSFIFRGAVPAQNELTLVRPQHDVAFSAQVIRNETTLARGILTDYLNADRSIQTGLVFPTPLARSDEWSLAIEQFDLPEGSYSFVLRSPRPMLVFHAPHAGSFALFFGSAVQDRSQRFERIANYLNDGNATLAMRLALLPIGTVHSMRAQLRQAQPRFAEYQRPARTLDTHRYRFVREIVVPESESGAVRVPLGFYAQAYMETPFDVRIVDHDNRQWPFVFGDRTSESSATFAVLRDRVELRGSVYRVVVPARITPTSVRMAVPGYGNGRSVELRWKQSESSSTRTLVQRFAGGDAEFRFSPDERVQSMEFTVDDGDEEPLPIAEVEVRYETNELILFATPGTYRLLVGSDDGQAPSYAVGGLRPYLSNITLKEVRGGNWQRNEAFAAPRDGKDTERKIVWSTLAFAVLVLLLMVGIATQKESDSTRKA